MITAIELEELGFLFSKTRSLGSMRKTYWTDTEKGVVGRILTKEDGTMMCWNMGIHMFRNNHVKIEAQMADAEMYTFFEGVVDSIDKLRMVLKMIGYES